MNVSDLNPDERTALEAALFLLVNADGRVRHPERKEIEALCEELGEPDLVAGVRAAGERIHDADGLLPLVAKVEREDARELLRTILIDVANVDGHRDSEENAVVNLVTREWARR